MLSSIRLFVPVFLLTLSTVGFADPYTFDDPSEFVDQDVREVGTFKRSDGMIVKAYEEELDGVIGSAGSACWFQLVGWGQMFQPGNDPHGGRCVVVPAGSAAEIYYFPNSLLALPFAEVITRFDGYRYENMASPGKHLASFFIHIKRHWLGYSVSIAILALIGALGWLLLRVTPARGWWNILRGFWFVAGGVVVLSYVAFVAMITPGVLLIPIVILSAGGTVLPRMVWKFVRGIQSSGM